MNRPASFHYFENREKSLCSKKINFTSLMESTTIIFVPDDSSEHTCHKLCNTDKSCWGPEPNMCFECKLWKLKNNCVEDCKTEKG